MGKIASPGVLYCDGEGTASLSVNGQIYSTENPPISYMLSGNVATISDALGVIATVDLSGALVEVSRQVASPDTPYCGGNAKSVLKWSEGLIESSNPPISYSLTTNPLIKVDWGNGDVDYLTGTNWTISASDFLTEIPVGNYTGAGRVQGGSLNGTTLFFDFEGTLEILNNCQLNNIYSFKVSGGWVARNSASFYSCGSSQYGYIKSSVKLFKRCTPSTLENGYNFSDSSGGLGSRITVDLCGTKVTSNTGEISERETTTSPTVSLVSDYDLSVSDSTGEIFSRDYATEPAGFQVICYDYDISEVSYACEGCPSGTLFECTCPATNTKYCYGFDPDNPDVFKPLFESPIA